MRRGRRRAEVQRTAWRPLAVAAIGAAVLTVALNGAWARLAATATNTTPQNAASGTLRLTMTANGVGFTQPVANMAPGDTVRRYVDVANSGTLTGDGLTLTIAATGSSTLLADTGAGTRALRLSVSTCTGTWAPATGACSGTATQVLAPAALPSFSAPVTLVGGAISAGQVHRLQVTLLLPDQTETTTNGVAPATTIQGQAVDVTYTFTEGQRAATTTSS